MQHIKAMQQNKSNVVYQSNVVMEHIKAMQHIKSNVAYQSNTTYQK
jgi:hypothetical protein